MIRVAHLSECIDARSGGTTTALLSSLDASDTRGGRITSTVYTVTPPTNDAAWDRIRREPHRFVLAGSRGWILRPRELGRIVARDIEAGKVDVLHVHGLWCPDLVYAATAAKRAGVPALWQSHGMLLRSSMQRSKLKKRVFLSLGLQRSLRDASGFISPSRAELKHSALPTNCPADRQFYIGYPIAPPRVPPDLDAACTAGRKKFDIADDAFVFAFLGRLHPIKRVEMTIAAFADAMRRGLSRESTRLLILGQGDASYTSMLRGLATSLGVEKQIIFAGWIDDETKFLGLAAANAIVLNSSIESFGYVLFEAASVGTPAVVSSNLLLADEFHELQAGLRADNSVEGVATGMLAMANATDEARRAMADAGTAWAHREFSLETTGRRLEEAYQYVLEHRSQSHATHA